MLPSENLSPFMVVYVVRQNTAVWPSTVSTRVDGPNFGRLRSCWNIQQPTLSNRRFDRHLIGSSSGSYENVTRKVGDPYRAFYRRIPVEQCDSGCGLIYGDFETYCRADVVHDSALLRRR